MLQSKLHVFCFPFYCSLALRELQTWRVLVRPVICEGGQCLLTPRKNCYSSYLLKVKSQNQHLKKSNISVFSFSTPLSKSKGLEILGSHKS